MPNLSLQRLAALLACGCLPLFASAGLAARAIARQGQSDSVQVASSVEAERLYAPIDPTTTISDDEKTALIRRVEYGASAQGALFDMAIFPGIMLVAYIGMFFYFYYKF